MTRLIGIVISSSAAIFLSSQFYSFVLLHSDVYIMHGVWADNVILKPGEQIVLNYDFTRKRLCKTDLIRAVWGETDNKNYFRITAAGGASPPGRMNPPVKVPVDLPDLPVGCYKFYTFTLAECSEGRHDFMDPPVRFCVSP